MSKTWKESKAVKQGRSEKGRPKPKMEPYKIRIKKKFIDYSPVII